MLELKNVSNHHRKHSRHKLENISLTIHKGEILGIAGVEGNGQTELVEAMTGMGGYTSGTIEIGGKDIQGSSVAAIRALKVAHIPEDRMTMGIAPKLSLTENMIADKLSWKKFFKNGIINRKAVRS